MYKEFAGNSFCIRPGANARAASTRTQSHSPKIFDVFTPGVCECSRYVRIEGGGKGVNTCFKRIPQKYFLHPHECECMAGMYSHKIKSSITLFCMYWFCAGG